MDEVSLSKWQWLDYLKIYIAQHILQGMKNNVKFAFSVGHTPRAVCNYYWARQIGDTKYNI